MGGPSPAGHYEFNLTTAVHQAFAVRLKDVAFAEPNEGFNWFNIVYDMYSHAVKVGVCVSLQHAAERMGI